MQLMHQHWHHLSHTQVNQLGKRDGSADGEGARGGSGNVQIWHICHVDECLQWEKGGSVGTGDANVNRQPAINYTHTKGL